MGKILSGALILGILGLGIGYLIFGRVGGDFIAIQTLFSPPDNILSELGQKITGVTEARNNILISGAVGLGLGAILGATRK